MTKSIDEWDIRKQFPQPVYFDILGGIITNDEWETEFGSYYQRAILAFLNNETHSEGLISADLGTRGINTCITFYNAYVTEKAFAEAYDLKFNGIHKFIWFDTADSKTDCYKEYFDDDTNQLVASVQVEIKNVKYDFKDDVQKWQSWLNGINTHHCDFLLIYGIDSGISYCWDCRNGVPLTKLPNRAKKQIQLEKVDNGNYYYYLRKKVVGE